MLEKPLSPFHPKFLNHVVAKFDLNKFHQKFINEISLAKNISQMVL